MQEDRGNDSIGIITDPSFKEHCLPGFHFENPARLTAILDALEKENLNLIKYSPGPAERSELLTVHTEDHISLIEKKSVEAAGSRFAMVDADTWMSEGSLKAALNAVGGGFVLADKVMSKEIQYGYSISRPPGHHAITYKPMGFCLFNNIALTARYLMNNYNISKIAIVDFDVHHGNGAQQIFYHYNNVLTISMHQYPMWPPNSGWPDESGEGDGMGYNINFQMEPGSGDYQYNKALTEIIVPVLKQFEPEVILVAAGYDSHKDDFIAQINLTSMFYGYFIRTLMDLDNTVPLICFLEGGYDLNALAESVIISLKALDKKKAVAFPTTIIDASDNESGVNQRYFDQTKSYLSNYWNVSC